MSFTKEEVELLREFVSDPEDNVFVVFSHKMPGMVGAVYARYSRARGGFRETLLREFVRAGQLDHRRADELTQRVLISFGDDSVQELETPHLSLERISNIATKAVEDRRLGAYIEQSSRYVFYDEQDYDERDGTGRFKYVRALEIMSSPYAARYEETMDFVFATYCRLIEPMQEYFRRRKPLEIAEYEIREGRGKMRYADCQDDAERKDFERTWKADIRSKTCDTLRILLPAATLTNVGMHANGRTLEHMLRRLYSSELAELQGLARKAHTALNTLIPRYVQRARRDEYIVDTRKNMQRLADGLLRDVPVLPTEAVVRHSPDVHGDLQLAAMLYPFTAHSLWQIRQVVGQLSPERQEEIALTYIGNRRTRRDRPGRALEWGYPWTFDLIADFGIYRDLHRHRMCSQERQLLTTRLGFCEIPEEIAEAGYKDEVEHCVDRATKLYEMIRSDLGAEVAQYPVLFGFKVRWYLAFNDREAQHLLELRTQSQGHRSYRRLCQHIYWQILRHGPSWLKKVLQFVDTNDYDWPRADSEARQRVKEAKLEGGEA